MKPRSPVLSGAVVSSSCREEEEEEEEERERATILYYVLLFLPFCWEWRQCWWNMTARQKHDQAQID
jgi:hypothetical protein